MSGRANGPVLLASISCNFYPKFSGGCFALSLKEKWQINKGGALLKWQEEEKRGIKLINVCISVERGTAPAGVTSLLVGGVTAQWAKREITLSN